MKQTRIIVVHHRRPGEGKAVPREDHMALRGRGDRWLAGESIDGVQFEQNASVEITDGIHAGQSGSVVLLMALGADPLYLVELSSGAGDVRVRQSSLRRPSGGAH